MNENKKIRNRTRQEFLLTFFEDSPEYAEKEINGFWLVKRWDGNTQNWQVAVFTQESYQNYLNYQKTIKKQNPLLNNNPLF